MIMSTQLRSASSPATRCHLLPDAAERVSDTFALRAAPLRHLGAPAALAIDRADRELHEIAGEDALRDRGLVRRDEDLRLVALERECNHVRAECGAEGPRIALHRLRGLERGGERDQGHAVERLDPVAEVARPGQA